ncbi:unnamed protein product [Hyaloperonospora brassicae]|uniref:Dol-P-Glc:Glc(2)Man(9)GlcNAc(2)-PP-Dol alpha-1,2-glucosyltransferase n=1 Tax=Hyaloperonospora brassicae TaxID=162125 RepID=A0AAV0U4R1_HYABA|nr:unnamed protein product [Hyaloperonospora brassicae]
MAVPSTPCALSSVVPVLAVLAVLYSWLLATVNQIVPDPYMDEIFHIPQAQHYCQDRFHEWDPKLTTFPGLYLVSTLCTRALSWMNGGAFYCSVSMLRSLNVVFALGNVVLCVLLRRHVSPHDHNGLLHAVRVAAFPPLFFFSFLFYTDSGATFFVLLTAWLAERVDLAQNPSGGGSFFVLSATSGAVAVLFRQTNIVWVGFVAGTVVVRYAELAHSTFIYGFPKIVMNFIRVVVSNLPSILLIVWPFVVIVAGFVVFLLMNGGIVVGDKSSHEVTFHGAQVLYFLIVAASGFGLSLVAPTYVRAFAASVRRNGSSVRGFLFISFLIAATVGIIFCFSPVHKFMLADNRHYTFYIWRKFFLKHDMAKFVPAPLYVYLGWRCRKELERRRSPLWTLVFVLATCLVLVPSPLVEPRYFCVPFLIFHLNTGNQAASHLWTAIVAYMMVNALTLYVFLYCPYDWVDGSTARFMW